MKAHPNAVMHSGGSAGGTTMMIQCRDHDRAVVAVTNVNGNKCANTFLLALRILDLFRRPLR